MNVINVENDYRNGVVVQLDKDDIATIRSEWNNIQATESLLFPTIFAMAGWIIRELED